MVAAEVKRGARTRRHHGYLRLHQGRGRGPDAEAFLDRLTANRLPQKVGGIALTHMLNRRGRIELETTVVRAGRLIASTWSAPPSSSSACSIT